MNKLEGLPPIVYINLEEAVERNQHMVSMFEKFGVTNYSRFGAKRPSKSKHRLLLPAEYGCMMSHMTVIEEFAKTNEPYLIVMEDDLDLSPVEQWDFTWSDIMDRVGEFDILQLARLERPVMDSSIKFKPWQEEYATTGAYLITNRYAKALVSLFNRNQRSLNVFPNLFRTVGPVADYALYVKGNAKTLCIFWYKLFPSQIAGVALPEQVLENHRNMHKTITSKITLEDIFG